jgi:glutaredoxin
MSYFSDTETGQIQAWAASARGPRTLNLVLAGHGRDPDLETFAGNFADLATHLKLVTERVDSGLPHIRVFGSLTVSAVPLGRELAPFLKTLSMAGGDGGPSPGLSREVQAMVADLQVPASLTLYVSRDCPFCPAMVLSLASLAAASDRIRLRIVDAALFEEEARADAVMSVPCLILDGGFRWTGTADLKDVVDMMRNRDPSRLGSESLRLVLEEGRASWIAGRMMERGQLFPGFVPLLVHPSWTVRLGAMVVLEEVADGMPDVAAEAAGPLWEAFAGADGTVKGDILYCLGLAGDGSWAERLAGLSGGLGSDDLEEAAREALASIIERTRKDVTGG